MTNNAKATTAATPEAVGAKLGTVRKLEDGRPYVHFVRRLPYSVERVWSAITDPAELAKWFAGFNVELREGGKFEIWFTGESGECEGPAHVTGKVSCFEPPRVLECGSMRFELEPDGLTGCVLTFTDILMSDFARTFAELCNSVLGGWHRFLDALEANLDGAPFDHGRPEFDYAKVEVAGRDE